MSLMVKFETEFVSFPVRTILMYGDGVLLSCVYLRLFLICGGVV